MHFFLMSICWLMYRQNWLLNFGYTQLISQADWPYLKKTDSAIRAGWNRISGTFLAESHVRGKHSFF